MSSKVFRTILVEDEGAALRRLEKMAIQNAHLSVIEMAKSGKQAIEVINTHRPDLVLLDIELKDMTAFQVLSSLENDYRGQIIFITAFNKYAVEAFEIAATDYLLKPYDEDRFNKAIERVKEKQQYADVNRLLEIVKQTQSEPLKIRITEGIHTHYFLADQIIWVEADGYYSNIHRSDGTTILVRKTLKEMEEVLMSDQFSRVNRSAIINRNYIEKESRNIAQQYFYLKGNIKIKKSSKYSLE